MWECPEINTSSCERIHYCSNESILVQGESIEQDHSSTDRMLAGSRRTILLLLLLVVTPVCYTSKPVFGGQRNPRPFRRAADVEEFVSSEYDTHKNRAVARGSVVSELLCRGVGSDFP